MDEMTGGDLLMRAAHQARTERLGNLSEIVYDVPMEMLFDLFGGTLTSHSSAVKALQDPLDEVEQAVGGVICGSLLAAYATGVDERTFIEVARIGVQLAMRLPRYRSARVS